MATVIYPHFIGSGSAATAMHRALYCASGVHSDWSIADSIKIARGEPISIRSPKEGRPILFIANPHGFHAQSIIDGVKAGFSAIIAEKPVCVSLEEAKLLRGVGQEVPIAVCHGYRAAWGVKTLQQLVESGELGEVFAVEGRYWQSSAAQSAGKKSDNWKNDPKISGPFDVLGDLASHWTDLLFFLNGGKCEKAQVWKSYVNSETPHRDTHVQLVMEFSRIGRTIGSISKTVHGAGNHLEVNVLGDKGRASWNFSDPDRVLLAHGESEHYVVRKKGTPVGSRQAPFHGLGWLEGYVDIIEKALSGQGEYPTLGEALDVMETLLKA